MHNAVRKRMTGAVGFAAALLSEAVMGITWPLHEYLQRLQILGPPDCRG